MSVIDGSAYELLSQMAHHEAIDLYTLTAQPGAWHLQIGEPYMDGRKVFPLTAMLGDQRWYGGGWYGPWIDWTANQTDDPEAARRDIMIGLAAAAVGADALATHSPVLLDGKGAASQRGNPMTPREAAALVGLFLRSRDDFVYTLGEGFRGNYDRGLFYWIVARDRLPAAWRWFSACVATSTATSDELPQRIGESAIVRFDRVLRCRDRLHAQLQLPPTNNSLDEVLFNFDVALLKLSGAFDATAQIAHLAYLSGSSHNAGWRRTGWLRRLSAHAPTLAALHDDHRPVRDVIEIIGLLRNTIHGAALQGIAFHGRSSRTRENLIVIPEPLAPKLLPAVRRRGGLPHWGVRHQPGFAHIIDPGLFMEALVPAAAQALNKIMRQTEVERLRGVSGRTLLRRPPTGADDTFSTPNRERVRLLAGL